MDTYHRVTWRGKLVMKRASNSSEPGNRGTETANGSVMENRMPNYVGGGDRERRAENMTPEREA